MRNHAMRIGATMTVATSPATIRNVADLLDHLGGIDPNRVRMMRPLGLARAGPDRCEHPSGDDLRVRRGSRAASVAVDDETGDDPLPVEFADVEEAESAGSRRMEQCDETLLSRQDLPLEPQVVTRRGRVAKVDLPSAAALDQLVPFDLPRPGQDRVGDAGRGPAGLAAGSPRSGFGVAAEAFTPVAFASHWQTYPGWKCG